MLDCYPWASNHQPFDCWRAHHVYYVASQPRTSDRLISHWRALCLLAHDNWRCSIQPEIFTHQNFCLSRDSISVRQRESPVCLPLDYTCYSMNYTTVWIILVIDFTNIIVHNKTNLRLGIHSKLRFFLKKIICPTIRYMHLWCISKRSVFLKH